jgi:hypothetical protein
MAVGVSLKEGCAGVREGTDAYDTGSAARRKNKDARSKKPGAQAGLERWPRGAAFIQAIN